MKTSKMGDGSSRLIHIRLPEETHRLLRIRAAELDVSIQYWVEQLIEKALKRGGKAGGKS